MIITKPDVSHLGHVSGIQTVMEEGQEKQGVGLILDVFLEVLSRDLLFSGKEGCGYWKEKGCSWRETASVLVQAQT